MTTTPSPLGAIPSSRQLAWHALEYYGFLHFTVNTFTDREWGLGNESPHLFNPSNFSATNIVETAQLGGMRGLILTAKHHDGFCLWPSRHTTHSVAASPWRNGQGDVVAELAQTCAAAGMKFGIYLSPWDRNHSAYGHADYIEYYHAQLRELLSNYGPLFEVWFDGANGGDGYYGGTYERRNIDNTTYYPWERTFELVRELQPDACIFSDAGPDIRWVGNEHGIAGDPCWSTLTRAGLFPGAADPALLNQGHRHGSDWVPAECDVSIRPGWFYHAHEDQQVRTPENLLDLYLASVGRGANLLLNLPVAPTGRIHEYDRAALIAFRQLRERLFTNDITQHARIELSSVHDGNRTTNANALRSDDFTYWMPDQVDDAPFVIARFAQPTRVNLVDLREYLPLGQRIDAVSIEVATRAGWQEVARCQSVGNRRLVRIPNTLTSGIRMRVLRSTAPVALRSFRLYDCDLW